MSRLARLASPFRRLDTRTAQPAPKVAAPIYRTAEHEAWRKEVLRRAGGRCQWPACGRTGVRLFADHIQELQDDGAAFDPGNGQALCGSHHTTKTAAARAARQKAAP